MGMEDSMLYKDMKAQEEANRYGRVLREALDRHAEALTRAAVASDKYAGRLVWATWALVLATGALVFTEIFGGH